MKKWERASLKFWISYRYRFKEMKKRILKEIFQKCLIRSKKFNLPTMSIVHDILIFKVVNTNKLRRIV